MTDEWVTFDLNDRGEARRFMELGIFILQMLHLQWQMLAASGAPEPMMTCRSFL